MVAHIKYDEWGVPVVLMGDLTPSYTGHEWDATLGIYYAKARFYEAGDRRFTAKDPIKGSITSPISMLQYLYCVDNPLKYVDPMGEMAVSTLRGINDLYQLDIIDENAVAFIILAVNLFKITLDPAEIAKNGVEGLLDVFGIDVNLDITKEIEPELKHKDATVQSAYVAFHEIAQVLAAKELRDVGKSKHGLGKSPIPGIDYPQVEAKNDWYNPKAEMDIEWYGNVWEVKPGYTSPGNFTTSLKKYIPKYDPTKTRTWHAIQDRNRFPGYQFDKVLTANLVNINGKQIEFVVSSLSDGKIGYFFRVGCEYLEAKDFVYDLVKEVNAIKYNAALVGAAGVVITTLVEDILTGGLGIGNDAPAFGALGNELAQAFSRLGNLFPQLAAMGF